jgi:4'-phosphopantetheinyl transferase
LGRHGKPYLEHSLSGIQFNLSHSRELALCAVVWGRAVGIDIEEQRPVTDAARIITRYFSPAEQVEYLSVPEDERLAAFYRGWTRKEAYLKATGTGLATALDRFDVSLSPQSAALLRIDGDRYSTKRWTLMDLDPAAGYAAAVAVKWKLGTVRCWSFPHRNHA